MFNDNVIATAVAKCVTQLATLTDIERQKVADNATLDVGDWLEFGDWPSRALMAGLVDAESAQRLHAIHTAFNTSAAVAERVVFLMTMGELAPMVITGRM